MRHKLKKLKIAIFIFSGIFLLTLVVFLVSYSSQNRIIKEICDWELKEAVYSSISSAVNDMPRQRITKSREQAYKDRIEIFKINDVKYNHYEDSILYFMESDEWEYRTLITDDKVLVGRKVLKKDIVTNKLSYETHKFRTNRMDLKSIIIKYRDILKEKGVLIDTPIFLSVVSEIFEHIQYDNFEDKLRYNYITNPFRTGLLDEIVYQAYLNIPFVTVYKRIEKIWLYPLIFLLVGTSIIILYFLIAVRMEERNIEIVNIKGDNYRIGHFIFMFEKQILRNGKSSYHIPPTLAEILLMLLKNEDHSLHKDVLLYKLTNSNNMHANITRLRNFLAESKCPYKVIFKRENDTYYLAPKNSGAYPNLKDNDIECI